MPRNSLTESIKAKLPPGMAEVVIAAVRPIKSEEIITRVTALRRRYFFVDINILVSKTAWIHPRGNTCGLRLLKNDKNCSEY